MDVIAVWEFDTVPPDPAVPGVEVDQGGHRQFAVEGKIGWFKSPCSGFKIDKYFDDTRFYVDLFGDMLSGPHGPGAGEADSDASFSTGVWVDGQNACSQGLNAEPNSDITFMISNFMRGEYPKGEHTIDLMLGNHRGHKATWILDGGFELRIFEVRLPRPQVPRR